MPLDWSFGAKSLLMPEKKHRYNDFRDNRH